ncbi:hypothetical protein LINPERPRIM_LOCUS22240 [Linum perenne]
MDLRISDTVVIYCRALSASVSSLMVTARSLSTVLASASFFALSLSSDTWF